MQKNLILITDEFPNKNAAGIGQAMFNFFSGYPEKLWVLTPDTQPIPPIAERLIAFPLLYKDVRPKPLTNRLGRWVNRYLMRIQMGRRNRLTFPSQLPHYKHTLVVLATTSPHKLQVGWVLQQKGYALIPFFMDDWLDGNNLKWPGGSIQKIAGDILSSAPGFMAISNVLAETLTQRYHLAPKPVLVLQNPAMEKPEDHLHVVPQAGKLLYAGSIWPMHADALVLLAQAVHALQRQGQVQFTLSVYCPEAHWKKHKPTLMGAGVTWEGWMPEADAVRAQYPKAWLLVCCASFLAENAAFTQSSIQSKISDYTSASRPILYIGPSNSASADFIKKLDCGYIVTNNNPDVLVNELMEILTDTDGWKKRALASKKAANSTLSSSFVQKQIHNFLTHFFN